MAQEEKARRLVEKFKKTPEQLAEEIKKQEAAKNKLTKNTVELESNLSNFNKTLDPILDPNTGQPLCWVRRPSAKEWEDLTPTELLKYQTPEEIPTEVAEKLKDHQFKMMETLIENPKHDAEWWKANSNLLFQEMFQIHLTDVYRKLGIMSANF